MRRRLTLLAAAALAIGHPRVAQSALAQQPQTEQARPSSFTLIDRALEAKTIDAETAHKYRVFAAYGDTRLPAALRGDDSGMTALPRSVAEVGALLATFSAATRTELAPFFMRPADPGSWVTLATLSGQEPGAAPNGRQDIDVFDSPAFDPDPSASVERPATAAWSWKWVHAVGGKAKVWWQDRYPTDAAIAQGLASALTARIWPRLTGLMNQEPFPDNGIVNNGGDAALDFYLVHSPSVEWIGLAKSALESVPCHPARFLLIDTRKYGLGSEREYGVLQIATHELMHAITFAYRVRSGCPNDWINEASADWASNWLYPLTDGEHAEASIYLNSVKYKIDNPGKGGINDTRRYYGEHLLPYFVQQATGSTDFMPRMWTNFKTMDVFAGIDAVVPGRLEKFWPKFLVRLWNREPVDAPDGFKQWDRIPVGPIPEGGLDVVDIRSDIETRTMNFLKANISQFVFEDGVQPMAGHYRWFRFEPSVRSVVFRNTIREQAILHGTVWGIEKIGGTWKQPVDWTEELQKTWCRDAAAEDIEELVLIFGNHDWRTLRSVNPTEEPTVEARGVGCNGWIGSATLINTITSTDPAMTIVETFDTSLHFAVDSSMVVAGQPPEYWKSVAGTIRWRVQVTGACTGSASGSVAIPNRDDHQAVLQIWSEGGKLHHSGGSGVWPGDQPGYTITCGTEPSRMVLFGALGYFATDGDRDLLAADGKSFQGSFTNSPAPGITVSHRYSFRCDRGC